MNYLPLHIKILFYALLIFLGVSLGGLSVRLTDHVQAASDPDPLGLCDPFFKDGALVVTRCIDQDLDKVCYISNYGLPFCLPIDN